MFDPKVSRSRRNFYQVTQWGSSTWAAEVIGRVAPPRNPDKVCQGGGRGFPKRVSRPGGDLGELVLGDKSTLPEIVSAKYKSAHQVRTNSVCEIPQSRVVQLVPRKCQSDIQDDLPSVCDGCCPAFYCPRRRLRPRGRVLNTVDSIVKKCGIGG